MKQIYRMKGLCLILVLSLLTLSITDGQNLAFQILSYDCNSGVLQYQMTGGDGSGISLSLPGVYGGTVYANNTMSYTFDADGRQGRTVTGTATQGGTQIQINFTNGCNLSSNPPSNPPTNPPANQPDLIISRELLPNLPTADVNHAGNLEEVDCNHIKGWIVDFNAPNQSAKYDIYINGQLAASNVVAKLPRPDVATYFNISGYNAFGYNVSIPAKYKVGESIEVLVKYAGTATNVSGCPKSSQTCQPSGPSYATTADNCGPDGVQRFIPGSGQTLSMAVTNTGQPSLQLDGRTASLTSKLVPVRQNDVVAFDASVFVPFQQKKNLVSQLITAGSGGVLIGQAISTNQPNTVDVKNRSMLPIVGIGTSFSLPLLKSLFIDRITKASIELAYYNKRGQFMHRQQMNVNMDEAGNWQPLRLEEHISESGYVAVRLQNLGKHPVWFNDLNLKIEQSSLPSFEKFSNHSSKFLKSRNGFTTQVKLDEKTLFAAGGCDGIWLNIDVTVRAKRYPVISFSANPPSNSTSDQPNPDPSMTSRIGGGSASSVSNPTSSTTVVRVIGKDRIDEQEHFRKYERSCEALEYMFNKAVEGKTEVGALITSRGLIMLPNKFGKIDPVTFKRTFDLTEAGIKRDGSDGAWYLETSEGKAYISAFIHTHPNHEEKPSFVPSASPSNEDMTLAFTLGSSVATYIIAPQKMSYYEAEKIDQTNTVRYIKDLYTKDTAQCSAAPRN